MGKKKAQPKFDRLQFETRNDKPDNEGIFGNSIHHMRRGAAIHKQVRQLLKQELKVGMSYTDVVTLVENKVRELTDATADTYTRGMGFPCGISVNHIAAHDAPNFNDTRVLLQDDVIKIDFGVQFNGYIIDSAFTHTFESKYDPLLKASYEATMTGIKHSGPDAILGEIGEAIEEVMTSYEVELNGKMHPIKCVKNLNGHNIGPYKIHHGKTVPIVKSNDTTRMAPGEFFAIETFGTTGRGYVVDDGQSSHYMVSKNPGQPKQPRARTLYQCIQKHFHTLPFARRYLMDALTWDSQHKVNVDQALLAPSGAALGLSLSQLVNDGIVESYPPLLDVKGSFVSQFEHTIAIHENGVENLTIDSDY